jgi:RimJ/RimL family protein N-acetyltransferase
MPLPPVTLRGRHVVLEPLAVEHAATLLAIADAHRQSYALQPIPRDLAGMETWVTAALDEQRRDVSLPFVVRRPSGEIVGSTRFMDIQWWTWLDAAPAPVPTGPDVVEIGWTFYAVPAQRTAVNSEAKLLLCTYAFEHWGVRRVSWKTDARNARSRAAILRLGAQFDGVLRAHRAAGDDTVRDSAFFSMLRSEWPVARARLEERLARA